MQAIKFIRNSYLYTGECHWQLDRALFDTEKGVLQGIFTFVSWFKAHQGYLLISNAFGEASYTPSHLKGNSSSFVPFESSSFSSSIARSVSARSTGASLFMSPKRDVLKGLTS